MSTPKNDGTRSAWQTSEASAIATLGQDLLHVLDGIVDGPESLLAREAGRATRDTQRVQVDAGRPHGAVVGDPDVAVDEDRVLEQTPRRPAQDVRDVQPLGPDRALDGGHQIARETVLGTPALGRMAAHQHDTQACEHGGGEDEHQRQRAQAQRVPHGWFSVRMIFIRGRNRARTMKPTNTAITISSTGSSHLNRLSMRREVCVS